MRSFDYKSEYANLLSPEIVSYLTQIHEWKGRQDGLAEEQRGLLSDLIEIAKIQSTEGSNRIEEGFVVTKEGAKTLSPFVREYCEKWMREHP